MRLTILGSGTAVPSAEAFPASVLVEAGEQAILIDAGPGVVRRLAATGVSVADVTTILLTHYHPDHTAGLVEFLFALRSPDFAGRPPLTILGGVGLHRLLGALRNAWPRWLEPAGYELEEREIEPGRVVLEGVDVLAVAVDHVPESLAYRVEETTTGAAICVSGDADSAHGLVQAARSVDVFVCEAPFAEDQERRRHLSGRIAGEVAREAGAAILCLTHLYPISPRDRIHAEATEAFGGDVVLAEDLLSFDLGAAPGVNPTRNAGLPGPGGS